MNKLFHFIILFGFFSLINFSLLSQKKAECKVLLIGVSDYPKASGWNKLSSTNDLDLISKTYLKLGVKPANIFMLKDTEVTRNAILKAIDTKLIQAVSPGDFAIFHFSGHGQQIIDNNGDEFDGLDEALVPYDSPKQFDEAGNHGEKLLRDDDLAKELYMLRQKLGPEGRLLVSFDACHSGSVVRGIVNARGTDQIMADPKKSFIMPTLNPDEVENDELLSKSNLIAPQIVFYSSSPKQLSYEYTPNGSKSYGLFSYAYCKALNNLNPDDNYQDIWDKVRVFMNTQTTVQNAVAEGNLQETVLQKFKSAKENYYAVTKSLGRALYIIEAGQIHGITKGSTIEFFVQNKNSKMKLSDGIVDEVRAFDCDVILNKKIGANINISQLKAKIKNILINDLSGSLSIQSEVPNIAKKLKSELKNLTIIKLQEQFAELNLNVTKNAQDSIYIALQNKIGETLFQEHSTLTSDHKFWINKCLNRMVQYVKSKKLIDLETKDDFLKATISIQQPDSNEYLKPVLRKNQDVKIVIKNTGKEGFFFSLFDVQSDYTVVKILPMSGMNLTDLYLEPNESYSLLDYQVDAPFGNEVLKLICTKEAISFGLTRGLDSKPTNAIQSIMDYLSDESSGLRGPIRNLSSDKGFIGSFAFKTIE